MPKSHESIQFVKTGAEKPENASRDEVSFEFCQILLFAEIWQIKYFRDLSHNNKYLLNPSSTSNFCGNNKSAQKIPESSIFFGNWIYQIFKLSLTYFL